MTTATAPMISVPLKATNEIDWVQPLKRYIRETYGDDPEKYAEECATLNRLRQDMRGAGKDSAAGRDLLYRYYGQLEFLDLRFPVDENHIKISFTWFDAFTHKATAQYSLAYEKASIIFNISAVLSCHAAHQNRTDDAGLKTAYHSFQAAAGMFTYINENFLHAPSTDLSRDTVKTLVQVMLAQAQEVFLEKQIADGKKVGMLAKLAGQAAYLYSQAVEGVQENVNRVVFEKVWLLLTQIKVAYMTSTAQYYQALADDDANAHGTAIARLQLAEKSSREATRLSNTFPSNVPVSSNLSSESGTAFVELCKRQLANIQERLVQLIKDNDYIYHQTIPAEAGLSAVTKLPAAKAIPVSELYAGKDIQQITGPDIFHKIVPIAVTESASMYDEEKAKLIRAESERVEIANDELAASLDYLRLPGALQMLKGGSQEVMVNNEFKTWCNDLAHHEPWSAAFDHLSTTRRSIIEVLEGSNKQLDMEESVCEKMRSKYEAEWSQQPSSRLTTTLRNDIRSYREALDAAGRTDSSLYSKYMQNEATFTEMKTAGETGEADVLFQTALLKAGAGSEQSMDRHNAASLLEDDFGDASVTVSDQINKIEDLLKKLNLIKRERGIVLKDLKDKVHDDDISQVLILNKKSISNHEQQLFQSELEKFRGHQTRLLQANHKQTAMLKELTTSFNTLLQDKRVRSEQSKYESITRKRSAVMIKYQRAHEDYQAIESGLANAKGWYAETKAAVDSLAKNVGTFFDNRRTEGAQLLQRIEQQKANLAGGQADREREKLRGMMDRMAISSPHGGAQSPPPRSQSSSSYGAFPTPAQYPASHMAPQISGNPYGQPPNQPTYTQMPSDYGNNSAQYPPANQTPQPLSPRQLVAQGYPLPPPPPGPPPLGPQQRFPYQAPGHVPTSEHYGYQQQSSQPQQTQHPAPDPWAGLNAWK